MSPLWQYNIDLLWFYNSLLLHDCPSPVNQINGAIVQGDDSGNNVIWTTTNCNDEVTTQGNNNKQYLFCGNDKSTNIGGTGNEYHYPSNICGTKTIIPGNDNSGKIVLDTVLTNSTGGRLFSYGGYLTGALLRVASTCSGPCAPGVGAFDPNIVSGSTLFFAHAEDNKLLIFSSCLNSGTQMQDSITVEGFNYGLLGIQQPSGGPAAVFGDGTTTLNSKGTRCVVAIACPSSSVESATINVDLGNPSLVVGTPNFPISFVVNNPNDITSDEIINSNSVTMLPNDPIVNENSQTPTVIANPLIKINGIKVEDRILLPGTSDCSVNIHNDGVTANFTYANTDFMLQIANGGKQFCIGQGLDPLSCTLFTCDYGSDSCACECCGSTTTQTLLVL